MENSRQLTLIGSGITDYLDSLFAPEWTAAIVDQIDRELKKWTDWEVCDWQDLSQGTPLASLGARVVDTPCSVIPIDQPFDQRRYRERAEAIAPVTFEVVQTADGRLINTLIELHGAR
jgi:hypothetical protein